MSVNFVEAHVIPGLVNVNSSVIKKVNYVDGDLYIVFISGAMYVHKHVPMKLFMQFLLASSHGQFYNSFIRDEYDYDRVR